MLFWCLVFHTHNFLNISYWISAHLCIHISCFERQILTFLTQSCVLMSQCINFYHVMLNLTLFFISFVIFFQIAQTVNQCRVPPSPGSRCPWQLLVLKNITWASSSRYWVWCGVCIVCNSGLCRLTGPGQPSTVDTMGCTWQVLILRRNRDNWRSIFRAWVRYLYV